MFKKDRNALLDEMREIARKEAASVVKALFKAGIVSSSTYRTGDMPSDWAVTTELVTRERARKDAEYAADHAVREYRNAEHEKARAKRQREMEEYRLTKQVDAAVADAFASHRAASDASSLAFKQLEGFGDLHEKRLDALELLLNLMSRENRVCIPTDAEIGCVDLVSQIVDGVFNFAHSSSPLRSGSGPVRPDVPASTVAENGCTCAGATSGVGASSAAPAPSTSPVGGA